MVFVALDLPNLIIDLQAFTQKCFERLQLTLQKQFGSLDTQLKNPLKQTHVDPLG